MLIDKIGRLLHLGMGKQNIIKSQADHEWKEKRSPGKVQGSRTPLGRCLLQGKLEPLLFSCCARLGEAWDVSPCTPAWLLELG